MAASDKAKINNEVPFRERRWILFTSLFIGGIVIAVTTVICMPIIYDVIIDTVVLNMMVLSPSSPIFPEWKDPPLPLYSSFYIFHVENPDAILEGIKPVLSEKGPYVYRVEVPRENVTFNGNGTLTSTMMYTYYFEQEMSVGPETDVFTMVNPVAVSTTILAKHFSLETKERLSASMDLLNETVFMNRSVSDILWGYQDGFLSLVDRILPIPGWDSNQFGLLFGRNETGLGSYTVYDGTENQSILNQFERFDGRTELDWWYTPEANMLNGTDGTMYHPYIKREELLELFHPDLCRSMPFVYEEDMNFNGVPLFKFVMANYSYANASDHPPNAGFSTDDMWAPSGVLRQDPCRFSQPIAISNPHFYNGDPVLYQSADGLNPSKKDHESILAVEEMMGLPYFFKLRLQISALMEPVHGIRQVENVPRLYFPLTWFEQSVEADDYIISMYKKGFVTTEKIMDSVQWLIFSVAVVVSIASVYYFIRWYRRRQKENTVKTGEDSSYGLEGHDGMRDEPQQDKISVDSEVANAQDELNSGMESIQTSDQSQTEDDIIVLLPGEEEAANNGSVDNTQYEDEHPMVYIAK